MFSDFVELLQLFEKHSVKYMLIGGYAVGLHAEPRYTKDMDLWVEASTSNAKKIMSSLKEFGAPIDNLTIEELAKPGLVYVFGVPPLRVDIINRIKRASFAVCYRNMIRVPIGKTSIRLVGKSDLIKLKKLAGRPQDKADIVKLKSGEKN